MQTKVAEAAFSRKVDTGIHALCIVTHKRKEANVPTAKPVEKEGKVVSANRKFYVQIGRTQREIPTGAFVSADTLKQLVGQTVSVTVVGKSIVAIGRRPRILCYVPVDKFVFDLVQADLQKFLQKKYTEAGIITAG